MSRVLYSIALVLCLACLGATLPLLAHQPAPETPPAPETSETVADDAPALDGMRVSVDEMGRLRLPTPEEDEALVQAIRQRFGGERTRLAEPVERADGSVSLVVGPAAMRYSLARVATDGTPETTCVEGLDDAVEALEAPSLSAAERQALIEEAKGER